MTETLLVIDGHSMAYRAFFALPVENFTTRGGIATNAVYGFASMLTKLMESEQPSHIAVAFDLGRKSFRTEEYPDYKGTRSETPEEFKPQIALIEEMLHDMGIVILTKENYEADDILATLSTRAQSEGLRVLIASGDRDTFQLVNDDVTVLYPGRSMSDLNYMTPEAIEEKYGVPPAQYPEIAALVGETSDNLPGVPGVGAKTAAQWINKFGGLDAIIEQADKIGGKRGEALRDHIADVLRNRHLNHLVTDLELDAQVDDLIRTDANREALDQLFDTLEFGALRSRVYHALGDQVPRETPKKTEEGPNLHMDAVLVADSTSDLGAWFEANVKEKAALSYSGEGRFVHARLDGVGVFAGTQGLVFDPARLSPQQETDVVSFLNSGVQLTMHGAKGATHAFASHGWALPLPRFDVELAAYLARPDRRAYGLEVIAEQFLGIEIGGGQGTLFDVNDKELAEKAFVIAQLEPILHRTLEEQNGLALLENIEIPVQRVFGHMEAVGVAIDKNVLGSLSTELSANVMRAQSDADAAVGHSANLASPKQLQGILFDELGMPKTRKTKTGYTTDAEALQNLFVQTDHPFLEALLRHRDSTKLLQMVTGLENEIQPDGRIHTTYHQTVAGTGRIASSDPNLQNIPARTDMGIRVREAFVAGPGFDNLMSVDYSQIEMRIMAHLSNDESLIEAFKSGEDLHRTMAAMVFGVAPEDVDHQLRNRIKATSYGLAYGLSAFGLSKQLGISVDEARDLRSKYFERFGGIGRYLGGVVEDAKHTGYTETMFGRRRYFPDLNSQNRRVAEMAERAALNAPVQGTAADIMKIATIEVEKRLVEGGYKSRMLLQIHDELVLEIVNEEQESVEEMVRDAMASPVSLSVPIEVAVGIGPSWKEAAH